MQAGHEPRTPTNSARKHHTDAHGSGWQPPPLCVRACGRTTRRYVIAIRRSVAHIYTRTQNVRAGVVVVAPPIERVGTRTRITVKCTSPGGTLCSECCKTRVAAPALPGAHVAATVAGWLSEPRKGRSLYLLAPCVDVILQIRR